jgi:hypothetical protein
MEQGRHLDAIARDLAAGTISRRTALKRFAGVSLGVMLPSALFADPALAKCPQSRRCAGKCCPNHAHCRHGKCKCSKGFTKCGKSCRNLQTDIKNCGACGVVCGALHASSAVCSSGHCAYTCEAGFSNCDQTGANSTGCECATPGCCGNSCQVTHQNGVGQSYYSCDPLGTPGNASTYSLAMAQGARAAWTAGTDSSGTCPGSSNTVSRVTATQCAMWSYSGTLAGHVFVSAPNECFCPLATDPTWN